MESTLNKKIIALVAAFVVAVGAIFAFSVYGAETDGASGATGTPEPVAAVSEDLPKYVFMFVGDGMSYVQAQSAAYYLGASRTGGEVVTDNLSFMGFPVAGTATTYDSTSFAPDSASTATSFATGNKTYSGTINMDTTFTEKFETIAEKLKAQKGYKVGVISSVNINHATPAAYYAHQASRSSYYDIGLELIASDFDYFAGGGLLKPEDDGTKENIYDLAEKAGYQVIKTQAEAEALKQGDGKAIVIGERLADGDALPYQIDAKEGEWVLADYVSKGIEMLEDAEEGFFLMVEGGKIDWACHANDAGATIGDVVALDDAVKVAIEFYNKHPEDTLIVVTGDHETGGLSIGFAGTDYDLYFTNLDNQKISYVAYDEEYVSKYKEENTPFADVLKDIKACFGLMTADDADATEDSKLVLTDYELGKLEAAYQKTLDTSDADLSQEEYILYGTYEPLSVTITHILNNKSGVAFTSYAHTGVPVPVFAIGAGEDTFTGFYDNTDIFHKLAALTGVK